jgi:hypothetical protein
MCAADDVVRRYIVRAIAGWLAGEIMEDRGFGNIPDSGSEERC